MWWWLLLPPTCLVSEVGGTGARVVTIGAPNLAGVGGWGHGCTWCGHRCPEPGGSAGTCRSTVAERLEGQGACARIELRRSEEHTSELQSLMRSSYAVFCL